jgi:hypothetical protein
MAGGARREPFRDTLLAQPAWVRIAVCLAGLALFWLAVAWAVSVP